MTTRYTGAAGRDLLFVLAFFGLAALYYSFGG